MHRPVERVRKAGEVSLHLSQDNAPDGQERGSTGLADRSSTVQRNSANRFTSRILLSVASVAASAAACAGNIVGMAPTSRSPLKRFGPSHNPPHTSPAGVARDQPADQGGRPGGNGCPFAFECEPRGRRQKPGMPSHVALAARLGFMSRQRLARISAEVSTLLTSLTFPATSLTWSTAPVLMATPEEAFVDGHVSAIA
ncbi:MAG: hypothetical protein JWO52_1647 [Gammaproteobacteria bacterium]|nr:hypothetical protein [Gammaproteobacteria bacterium]